MMMMVVMPPSVVRLRNAEHAFDAAGDAAHDSADCSPDDAANRARRPVSRCRAPFRAIYNTLGLRRERHGEDSEEAYDKRHIGFQMQIS
jgi:hypothetical protein